MPTKTLHSSWCFYACIVGILCGLFIAVLFRQYFKLNIAFLFFGFAICFLLCLAPNHLTVCFAFLAGIVIAEARVTPLFTLIDTWSSLFGNTITLTGTISDDPTLKDDQLSIRLSQAEIHLNQTNELPVENSVENFEEGSNNSVFLDGVIYVTLSSSYFNFDFRRSDQLTLTGELQPGFGTYLASLYRPNITAWERASFSDPLNEFKLWFAQCVHDVIPGPSADLGLSYLLGYKAGLSSELTETLKIVGMTHVVVASGAHLGILVNAAKKLFGKVSRLAGFLGSVILISVFLLIVGFTASMLRASLVSLLSLSFSYFGRHFSPVRLLTLVATITLLLDPLNLLNLGWQLSFASFAGLLILSPRLQRFFYGGKTPSWLASSLLVSFSTLTICAPILIYNFGSISLLAFIANLFILPTLPYAMLFTLLSGVSSSLPLIAQIISYPTNFLLSSHIYFMNLLSQQTSFVLQFEPEKPIVFALYVLPVTLIVSAKGVPLIRQKLKKCYNKLHGSSHRIRDA